MHSVPPKQPLAASGNNAASFIAHCPMCGKEMAVTNGLAICNHYPPDAVIRISVEEEKPSDREIVGHDLPWPQEEEFSFKRTRDFVGVLPEKPFRPLVHFNYHGSNHHCSNTSKKGKVE